MANDRERYAKQLEVWDVMSADNFFSIPAYLGTTAILCPYDATLDHTRAEIDQYPHLRREALDIADELIAIGKTPQVGLLATSFDFAEALKDPQISDLVVIGHGCLSSVQAENPTNQQNRVDWEDLALMADHLKTGRFIQRMCGNLSRRFNVPLGLMVTSSHNNVLAPVGITFMPQGLDDPANELVKPVTGHDRLTYEDIKELFPQDRLPLGSQVHVTLGAVKRYVLGSNASASS